MGVRCACVGVRYACTPDCFAATQGCEDCVNRYFHVCVCVSEVCVHSSLFCSDTGL